MPKPILVSACLLGLRTRYDGAAKRSQEVLDHLTANDFLPIPVCPEQLAGMPTPREQTCFACGNGQDVLDGSGQVVSISGQPMNDVFRQGAEEVLRIAQLCGADSALLKERSPSCGVHQIYHGEEKVPGMGVTTALLIRNNIEVLSEEDLQV